MARRSRSNELIEVFDDVQGPNLNPAFSPTLVQISNADQSHLTLTLQGAPAFGTPNAPKVRRVYTYLTQPDYPVPALELLASNSTCLIYLDVWERLITYVEDDAIREVALGGPDTATRAKIVWQVKAVPGRVNPDAKSACDDFTSNRSKLFREAVRRQSRPAEGQGQADLRLDRSLHHST